jgi:hypothetical protein
MSEALAAIVNSNQPESSARAPQVSNEIADFNLDFDMNILTASQEHLINSTIGLQQMNKQTNNQQTFHISHCVVNISK